MSLSCEKKYLKQVINEPIMSLNEEKKNAEIAMNINDQLKDGIVLSNSFIENLEFNKYKYDGVYIEQLLVSDLENQSFRDKFFKYLADRNFDQNQFEQIFFIKLLLVRIQQVDDVRSYKLLSSVFNNDELGYYLVAP